MTTQTITPTKKLSVTQKQKCDSCTAEGKFNATKGQVKLVFCAHHARSLEASLQERKFVITPETYKF